LPRCSARPDRPLRLAGSLAPAFARGGPRSPDMLDAVLIAAGTGFFLLAIFYVALCERL
jgi:hypothetical protein